jgi:hypothetical protein
LRNFAKKRNSKFKNEVILEVFNSQKVRGKNSKNHQISILGFECVAKDIEEGLKERFVLDIWFTARFG